MKIKINFNELKQDKDLTRTTKNILWNIIN